MLMKVATAKADDKSLKPTMETAFFAYLEVDRQTDRQSIREKLPLVLRETKGGDSINCSKNIVQAVLTVKAFLCSFQLYALLTGNIYSFLNRRRINKR